VGGTAKDEVVVVDVLAVDKGEVVMTGCRGMDVGAIEAGVTVVVDV
jgi:hypothetical protein